VKSTVETLEPTKVRLTVEADHEEIKPQMDKAYKEISKQANIPGFRKGHVPPRIIDQRFGRAAIIEQAVNEVLPRLYSQAVVENELRPMAQPSIEVTEIPATSGPISGKLVFTGEVDIVPAFEVPEITDDMTVEVDPADVTDEDVQTELDRLRARFATLKSVKRQAKTGDFVTIDLTATVDGEEVDSVSEVSYEIGSGTMLDGQDKALRGTHSGDDVTFTSKLKGGDHAGEDAEVALHVHSVKMREMPKVDDEFAQMASEFDTADELMEDMKKQAEQTKRSQQALDARDRLVEALLDKVEILLPDSVIDEAVKQQLGDKPTAKKKKEAREELELEFRRDILSDELAKKLEVQVSQRELIDYLMQMSQTYGIDINQLISSPEEVQTVVARLTRTKAIIEALRLVTVKDTNGQAIDLTEFFGDEEANDDAAEGADEAAEDAAEADDAAETEDAEAAEADEK